jgi:hypothetical protein
MYGTVPRCPNIKDDMERYMRIFKYDNAIAILQDKLDINLDKYKISNKRQILKNCVNPEIGLHILQESLK